VTRSVAEAPSINRHFYLSPSVAATLFTNEQRAIVFGFKKAIEDGHPQALEGLAGFYGRTRRFSEQATLYEEVAATTTGDPNKQADYLLKAADAAIRAQELRSSGARES
jgi:hypothetical protein